VRAVIIGGKMNYTAEKLEKSRLKFDYVASADDFNKAVDVAYSKTKNKYNVPGFRKGHAPKKVIEGMYGAGVFFNDAVNQLIDDAIMELENEGKYELVAVDSVKDVDLTDDNGVKFSIVMVVKPDVKLGEYKGLGVKKTVEKVTEKDVDEFVESERQKQARFVDAEKAAEKGDTVLLDYAGTVDGVAFDGGSAENYELELGSNTFIPGFEDQLVGVKAGEQKDVKVTFPKEYHAESLAGKEAVFACNVKAVRVKELPEVDDEFAKDVSEFDTLADYKADVEKKLVEQAEHKAEHEYEDALIEKIVDGAEVEIPDAMINQEAKELVHDFEYRLMYQGMRLDDYLGYVKMTREQLVDEYKERAEKAVKVRLVMEEIVKAENITIEDKDIDERLEKMAEEQSLTLEEFRKTLKREQINYVVNSVLSEKLLSTIKALNEGEAAPKKKAAKKAEKPEAEAVKEGEAAPKKKAPAKKAAEKTDDAAEPAKKSAAKKPAAKKTAAAAEADGEKKPAAKKPAAKKAAAKSDDNKAE